MRPITGNRTNSDAGNVVALDRFRSGRSLSPIRQAEAYWSALSAESVRGEVPFRSDIDPRGLENILEYSFILERIAPGIARFRLAGQHLNDLAGMEVRGMPLTSFFTIEGRKEITATLEHLFETPAVVELQLTAEKMLARYALEARMILLPLKSDFGDVSRVLGVLVADGNIGKGSYRFDVTDTQSRALTGHVAAPAVTRTPITAPVEPEITEIPDSAKPRRAYLSLVSNNDS